MKAVFFQKNGPYGKLMGPSNKRGKVNLVLIANENEASILSEAGVIKAIRRRWNLLNETTTTFEYLMNIYDYPGNLDDVIKGLRPNIIDLQILNRFLIPSLR